MFPVAHDLRTSRACDANLGWIELLFRGDILRRIGVGESHPSQADHRNSICGDRPCGDVRQPLPEPGVARTDDRELRVLGLELGGQRNESGDAVEGVFRRIRSADDRGVVWAPVMRFVVGVCNGDVNDRHAEFLQFVNDVVRFIEVLLERAVRVHSESVWEWECVVGIEPCCRDKFRAFMCDFRDDFPQEPCSVFEGSSILSWAC